MCIKNFFNINSIYIFVQVLRRAEKTFKVVECNKCIINSHNKPITIIAATDSFNNSVIFLIADVICINWIQNLEILVAQMIVTIKKCKI